MKDYYKILGLDSDATDDSIKQRFKELAFENHPDVSQKKDAGEIFIGIYEAYHILSDPQKRENYDKLYRKYIKNTDTQIPNEEYVISDIRNMSGSAREEARKKAKARYMDFIKDHDCFFIAGQKADGTPFTYNMHRTTGISGGVGPMGSIKSRSVSIPVPRSKKAHMMHRIGFIIKGVFFIIALLALRPDFLPDQGLIFKILISLSMILTGGSVTFLIYHFNKTRSKFFHAKEYFLVRKYQKIGYTRGIHPMISTTPAGLIVYLFRLIF